MPKSLLALLACFTVLEASAMVAWSTDVGDLSLEQLTQVRVTSVSRRAESISGVPASIFVISREDIRRSGASSLAEVLRLAPNLHVARTDSHEYAVTARGGSTGTANKMLVLVDGRTVYSPLFSGVFWDTQDVALEDVERIEVVSGPAGTLWGTNSVNGVINVITLSARETLGSLAHVQWGDQERLGALRHGFAAGPGAMRIWLRYLDREGHATASGRPAPDGGDRWMGGLRFDGTVAGGELAVLAEAFSGSHNNANGVREVDGRFALARWSRGEPAAGAHRFQAYIEESDRLHRNRVAEERQTLDLDYIGAFQVGRDHQLAVGIGHRVSDDRISNTPALAFLPDRKTLRWTHAFVQDEIAVTAGLRAILGVRVEHNSYTGAEVLPNARLAWDARPGHLLWGAVSRAVRAPSRIDRDLFLPGAPPHSVLSGGPSFESEVAHVVEVGYRGQLGDRFAASLTAFRHRFDRLRSYELVDGVPRWANGNEGSVSGLEAWATWQPSRALRLAFGALALDQDFRTKPGRRDLVGVSQLGNDPNVSLLATLRWDPTDRHELDFKLRHEGRLPAPVVPRYTVLDARFGWRVSPRLRSWIRVENLLDRAHAEFGDPATRAVFGRTWVAGLSWAL